MTITTIWQKNALYEIFSLINEIKPKFPAHAIQLLDLCENLQSNLRTPFNGTVSIISSDLPFIEWHVRITTTLFKPLLDQGFRRYSCLYSGKLSTKKLRECTLARRVQCTL